MKTSNPKISIIIPTLNAGYEFELVLERLTLQTQYKQSELIIIDSGSTDHTIQLAQKANARLFQIEPSSFNHGLTRNFGIEHARGEFACLMTQDAIPVNKYFLEHLVHAMEQENAAGAFARQIPRKDASPLARRDVEQWIGGSAQKRVVRKKDIPDIFALSPLERFYLCAFDNVASMVRKSVWQIIPFYEAAFAEDLEWAMRTIYNDHTIVYEPSAMVEHSHERSVDYLYKRTFQDHYRLYELFGVRTIPSWLKIMRSILLTVSRDWAYLFKHIQFHPRWLYWMLNTPRFALASALGQYHGAKAAARGIPTHQRRDV